MYLDNDIDWLRRPGLIWVHPWVTRSITRPTSGQDMGYPPQIGSGDKMAKTYPTRPIAQHMYSITIIEMH